MKRLALVILLLLATPAHAGNIMIAGISTTGPTIVPEVLGGFGANISVSTGYPKNAAGAFSFSATIPFTDLSGSLACGQLPALTGNVTTSGCAATIAALAVTNGMLAGSIAASKLVGTDIATVGTLTAGIWHATVIDGLYGGTGVANSGKTITLGGNLTTSGAFATTFTATNTTGVTLPTTGTLATLAGSEALTNKTVNGLAVTTTTGTLTLASSSTLATAGAFVATLTATATTSVTLPTAGTLATLTGSETFTNKTLTSPIITNIVPGADFALAQNGVFPFISIESGALSNTLYLQAGRVGIGHIPSHTLDVLMTATTGIALLVSRNLTATSTDSPVVYFRQLHASDDQAVLYVDQAGSAPAVLVNTGTLQVVPIKATTGQRYVCIDTAGTLVSSASACSGT